MKKLSILMLAAMLLVACQKENTLPKNSGSFTGSTGNTSPQPGPSASTFPMSIPSEGTYSGNFSLSTTGLVQVAKLPVQIVFTGSQFTSGDLQLYYSVGDGIVGLNDNVLSFTNHDAFPGYIIGSSIPLSDVGLSGNYVYDIKGDSLLLIKTLSDVTYTYKLKKQQ
jgi:hypothetical protein